MTQQVAPPTILFYTDNGIGLGHLTRQAAVALRADGAFQPLFLTMSAGFVILSDLGIPGEYFPSYGQFGIPKKDWEPIVAQRLLEAIRISRARAVVVDHVAPPRIFGAIREATQGVTTVWSRRGLWQPQKNRGVLAMSDEFDIVVEPGDVAAPIDRGATAKVRAFTTGVRPVVLTDYEEMLPKDAARRHLCIPPDGRAVLVSLGDKDPSQVGRFIAHTRSVLDEVSTDEIHLFAPLHPLHRDTTPRPNGIIMKPVYPIARYLHAFDGAISSAGYNSFHEIVGSGVPAVFVPHRGASIDDQRLRAEFASLSGRAHWASDVFDESFRRSVKRMLAPGESKIARATTAALGPMRGAYDFARLLADLAKGPEPVVTKEATLALNKTMWTEHRSTTLIDALTLSTDELDDLSVRSDIVEAGSLIVLVRDGDPRALYKEGILFESVLTKEQCVDLGISNYEQFLRERISGVTARYGVDRIMSASPNRDPAFD